MDKDIEDVVVSAVTVVQFNKLHYHLHPIIVGHELTIPCSALVSKCAQPDHISTYVRTVNVTKYYSYNYVIQQIYLPVGQV